MLNISFRSTTSDSRTPYVTLCNHTLCNRMLHYVTKGSIIPLCYALNPMTYLFNDQKSVPPFPFTSQHVTFLTHNC